MKKIIIGIVFFNIMLLISPTAIFAFENISINSCEPSLEVIVDYTGSGRRFDITTYISNIGDEQITITIMNFPGGGFKIFNGEELVYYVPDIVFPVEWNLTLDPGETEDIFDEFWSGVDDRGNKLPSGNYTVIGFVNIDSGNLFSEPVDIYLDKSKSYYILEILNHFSIFNRILSFINILK